MECLVSGGCAEQARGSAYRAESEYIFSIHPREMEKSHKRIAETRARMPQRIQVPGDTVNKTQMPAAGCAATILPNRNKQENNGVHQRHNGALTIGENRESAHTG
jgi:hypothetical protein